MEVLKTETNLAGAKMHRERGDECGKKGNLKSASDEFSKGIMLLLGANGTKEVLDLMAELREMRGAADIGVVIDSLNTDSETPAQIEERCRRIIVDSSAVLDMPKHSSPKLKRNARINRVQGVGFLISSLKVQVSARERKMALEDIDVVLSDANATDNEINIVQRMQFYINRDIGGTSTATTHQVNPDSIHGSFVTLADLSQVRGLNIGHDKGQPRHYVAKSFMDKSGPVSMSDGTPKSLPPRITSIDQIANMTASQLNQTYGHGAGTFFGETIFWHNHGGILLGKHKWEGEGEMNSDIGTVGEIWDMRWFFPSTKNALDFHRDMLTASRAEDNNGYLDSQHELSLNPGELSSLPTTVDADSFVFYGNSPRGKPTDPMGMAMMYADPPSFLQQYGAVFCVGRVVVKIYVIEGFNPKFGKLKRAAVIRLVNTVTKSIEEWTDGTRSDWNNDSQTPQLGVCAHCGNTGVSLKTCSRCQMVAYCDRECQRGHYKDHKKPCKRMALSREG